MTALCAVLPESGATYVNTNPEQLDGPRLGAEIKAKRPLLIKSKKPGPAVLHAHPSLTLENLSSRLRRRRRWARCRLRAGLLPARWSTVAHVL